MIILLFEFLRAKNFFLQFLVDILPLGSGSRKPKSTAGNNNNFVLFQNIVGSYEAQREGGILPLPAEGVEYCIVGCFFALCWDKMNVIENQDR